MPDSEKQVGDYVFPEGLDPREDLTYTIPYGSSEVRDLKWEGYVDVAHQADVQEISSTLLDGGENTDGIAYAAVKTVVVTEGGNKFSAIGSADETSNQVRQPEHVWTVAESRSLKRAIKKALNIRPATSEASEEREPKKDNRKPDIPDDVEFEDGHALANDDSVSDSGREAPEADGAEGW